MEHARVFHFKRLQRNCTGTWRTVEMQLMFLFCFFWRGWWATVCVKILLSFTAHSCVLLSVKLGITWLLSNTFHELRTGFRTLHFSAHTLDPPLQYFALGNKKACCFEHRSSNAWKVFCCQYLQCQFVIRKANQSSHLRFRCLYDKRFGLSDSRKLNVERLATEGFLWIDVLPLFMS